VCAETDPCPVQTGHSKRSKNVTYNLLVSSAIPLRPLKVNLLQNGNFPLPVQKLFDADADFLVYRLQEVDGDEALRASIRGIITRSISEVPAALIERLPNLGIIAACGVGYDLIPLELARERGIVVTNTPDVLNTAVAEMAIGLLFALLRQIPAADRYVRAGHWEREAFPLAANLAGKRVGIVGLGRIGKEIAQRLEPFDVALSYFGRTDQRLRWRFEPDLCSLANTSDVLILVMPGGRETFRMIDASVLKALGPHGLLVNVGRGSVIDEAVLIDALSRKTIAGAALDVFEQEPEIDARFFDLDNVILTPHIGSATIETRLAMAHLTLDNLRHFFSTGAALTPVNPQNLASPSKSSKVF
jgi:lactate dehydrogenase-like 2-hydroxyacid dehydrogenase